jgi:fructuronate reductase
LDEVVTERLPNPFIPDSPQRIATDTSQKIPIRFCNTIKAYQKEGNADKLVGIPLAIAGWLRYLDGTDDKHEPFTLSPDPLLAELQASSPDAILKNNVIFDTDLRNGGLDGKILSLYERMKGRGGVRKTLCEELRSL